MLLLCTHVLLKCYNVFNGWLYYHKPCFCWLRPSSSKTLISVCLSVRPFVRLSVRHTFSTIFLSSYHPEIFRSYYQWQTQCPCKKSQGQRSKVKVTEVMTPFSRFWTVTPAWVHIWRWNDAQSLIVLRRGALFFSRSSVKFQGPTAKTIVGFDPNWASPDCNCSLNKPMAIKWCTKLEAA